VDLPPHRYRPALDGDASCADRAVIALDELNAATPAAFAHSLDGVFEHSAWVAERTAALRPFDSRLTLLDALRATVAGASIADQMALIRAHPRLGSRGHPRAALTSASANEQRRAGLDACTAEERQRLDELNAAYAAKFDMPYILAVRGHDPQSIIGHAERRLEHSAARERQQALDEIGLIAGFRLADKVTSPAVAEIVAMRRRLTRPGGDARRMIREWLLAADLEVTEEAGTLMGRRRCGTQQALTLSVGGHHDAVDSIVGIAVAQRLRQEGVRLPFDLLLIARPQGDLGVAAAGAPPAVGSAAAAALEAAARAMEDTILVNAQWFEDHGTLQYG
jgi:OHCU decarboxylase